MAKEEEDAGCCSCLGLFLVVPVMVWLMQAGLSVIMVVEQFFINLVDSAKHFCFAVVDSVSAWWFSLIHTPYFHLGWVVFGALAIGLKIGWALAFRTRLPKVEPPDPRLGENRQKEARNKRKKRRA